MSDRNLRHKTVPVYDDDEEVQDEIDGKRTFDVQEKLKSFKYNGDFLLDLEGKELTFKRIQEVGFNDPIRIKNKDGLGLVLPENSNFSVSDVRAFVGGRRVVDVMDCKTQRALEMSMRDFEHYFEGKNRKHIYNVISLEFSQSKLESMVERPKVVDCLDWIDLVWPQHLKHIQTDQTNKLHSMKYPKVQKYCLMSVAGCYTDFHIDFGGTSVWYHIFKGGKIFWLIPPTNENLNLYERWTKSGNQGDIFFGDLVSKCQRVELEAGNSLMIPSGWIHAVYTPHDSLVFGGNFLHSFNIPMQLRISQIEERLKVPNRFRFPFFSEVLWYALERYVHTLTETSCLTEEFQRQNLLHEKKEDPAEDTNKENEKVKEHIHMTPFEYKGLQKLIECLEDLPKDNRNIPEGITDPDQVIEAGKVLLKTHSEDDYASAITGVPKAYWPVPLRSISLNNKVIRKPKPARSPNPSIQKKSGSIRVRRVRCKECEACQSSDCMECVFCKDMRKHGGPGTMKQTCIKRRCTNPILPSTARESVEATPVRDDSEAKKSGKRAKRPLSSSEIEIPGKVTKMELEDVTNNDLLDDERDDSPSPKPTIPAVVVSRVSMSDLMKYAIRPAVVTIEDHCAKLPDNRRPPGTTPNKVAWLEIFKHLTFQDLCNCMLVCKDFLQWCGSPSFWKKIDLSGKCMNPITLQCIVRRSPVSLNLSETNVSYKQLMWLLERSPALRKLCLIRCSWSCIAALGSASCPPLQLLDLSWASGFDDAHLKQLLATPKDTKPGQEVSHTRLRFCQQLFLAGTEITDSGLKLLFDRLPYLKSLDVSFCSVTSDGIGHLTCTTSSKLLSTIIAQHCHKLSDDVFLHCAKLQQIKEIDLRGCKNISPTVCADFIKTKSDDLQLLEPLHILTAL